MRAFTDTQADDLYELTSERAAAGHPMILTSNRKPTDWYPLFPNPVIAESLLDRLINTSHALLVDGPSYRPRKRPRPADSTTTGGRDQHEPDHPPTHTPTANTVRPLTLGSHPPATPDPTQARISR